MKTLTFTTHLTISEKINEKNHTPNSLIPFVE